MILLSAAVIFCGIAAVIFGQREEGFVLEREKEDKRQEEGKEAETMDPDRKDDIQVGSQGSIAGAAGDEAEEACVYVCGQVQSPGVYTVDADARIEEAILAAGGFTENAAVNYWNLADWVMDGQQIYVPHKEEVTDRPMVSDKSEPNANGSFVVNLNTASVAELTTLAGIGEQRAKDIVAYRERNGCFQSIEELMNVSGIKEATFERIRDRICVS